MNRLASYLQAALAGMPLNEAADRIGIQDSTLGRIKSGQVKPSCENLLRIARFLRVHPAHLYELQGNSEVAFLYRSLFPQEPGQRDVSEKDLYPPQAVGFHQRLQVLFEMGFRRQIETALSQVESAWMLFEPVFVQVVRSVGAKAAVLVVDFPDRKGQILFRWSCREPTAQALAAERSMEGWQPFVQEEFPVKASLFLKGVEDLREPILVTAPLRSWASGLSSVIEAVDHD